jgi:hypothetical protein
MSTERTHLPSDSAAPAPTPARSAAGLPAILGNRFLARLARPGARAAVLGPVVSGRAPIGNRARARLLSRVVYHDEDTIPDYEAPSYSPKSSDLRDAIMENAAGLVPATEGEAKFYAGVDKASIEKGRAWAAGRGTTYTDCIDFAIRRLASGLAKVARKATLPSPVFPDKSRAFVRASPGMDASTRPSPGDIFVMHSGTKADPQADSGNFAHTGVIEEVAQSSGGGTEQWTSYDGGQGTAAQLAHLEVTRTYDPDTNMYGGKVLYGWIDVDLV